MSLEDDEKKLKLDKEVAFYGAFVGAWIENRMEIDKQLLTLSALGIGLLITFYEKLNTIEDLLLWLGCQLVFLTVIIIILSIFKKNGPYIECLIGTQGTSGEQQATLEKSLQNFSVWAFRFFILGILLALCFFLKHTGFIIIKP